MEKVTMKTRFDGMSVRSAMVAMSALVLVLVMSIFISAKPVQTALNNPDAHPGSMTDTMLYRNVIDGVRAGGGYYDVVATQHRLGEFPLTPFVTVRPPTLAWLSAALGESCTRLALIGLMMAATAAWFYRLRLNENLDPPAIAMLVVMLVSTIILTSPVLLLFHETWAAVLIALSIALRTPQRYVLSIAIGFSAVMFRDLAVPYLLLMGFVAACEKRWREAFHWSLAIALVSVTLYFHANAVAAVVRPGDLASKGWNGLNGYAYFVAAMSKTTLLVIMPEFFARVIVPISLFGWMSWKSDCGLRVSGLLLGYATMLMTFARADNFYWGLLIAPLVLAGIGLAPTALLVLWKQCQLPLIDPAKLQAAKATLDRLRGIGTPA
jgi:hypothetical protein